MQLFSIEEYSTAWGLSAVAHQAGSQEEFARQVKEMTALTMSLMAMKDDGMNLLLGLGLDAAVDERLRFRALSLLPSCRASCSRETVKDCDDRLLEVAKDSFVGENIRCGALSGMGRSLDMYRDLDAEPY